MAEIARVLRPAGAVVITDPHPSSALLGGQAFYGGVTPGRPMMWVRNHYHTAAVRFRAFKAAGLVVEECDEPPFTDRQITESPLYRQYPEAARGAMEGLPGLWFWVARHPSPT